MKLNHIRDIVAVAERGSLRGAARQLGISQPAITRSLRELEQDLGATLFERKATGMGLTEIGVAVVRRAASIQSEIQRVHAEVQQLKGGRSGAVSVALSTASHISLLSRVIAPFQRRYPEVKLRIVEGLFPVIERDLQEGIVDFYVGPLGGNEHPPEMRAERLFYNQRYIFGRRGHPLAGATSLLDLAGARWVSDALTLMSEQEVSEMFAQHGLPVPEMTVRSQTSLSTIVAAASSDLLAILPQQWLPILEKTGDLVRIPVQELLAAPTICMVRRARLPLTPIAEHLSDLFRRAAIHYARTLPGSPVIAA